MAALAFTAILVPVALQAWFWLERPPEPPAPREPAVVLYDDASRRFLSLPLETYLVGVVGAEMPASFAPEALRAQAVVARTYAMRHMRSLGGPGCAAHPPADVCSDPAESQAWHSEEWLLEHWRSAPSGTPSEAPGPQEKLARIRAAVSDTRGIIATYDGRPIDAVYFASSGGRTEDARYVWGRDVPYLTSVPSPDERDPFGDETARFSWEELARRLDLPMKDVSAVPPEKRFLVLSRTPSGRAFVVAVSGRLLNAVDVRAALGLRSTWITSVEADRDGVTLHTRGWGHGVGMPQYGAEAMAERGASYDEIIRHYYSGVSLVRWTAAMGSR